MSANNENFAAYPDDWIQPVRYDHAAYRTFASKLDANLADLVADHGSRRTQSPRTSTATLVRNDLNDMASDIATETPPEQTSC